MRKDDRNYGSKKDFGSKDSGKGRSDKKKGFSKDDSFGKSKFSGGKGDSWSDKKSGFGKGRPDSKGGDNAEKWLSKFEGGEGKKRDWEDKKPSFGKSDERPSRGRGRDEAGEKRFFKSDDREGSKRSWEDKKPRFGKDEERPSRSRSRDESGEKKFSRSDDREGRKRDWEDKKPRFGKDEERPSRSRSRDESGEKKFSRSDDREGRKRDWEDKKPRFGKDEERPARGRGREEGPEKKPFRSDNRESGKRSWEDKKDFDKPKSYGKSGDRYRDAGDGDRPKRYEDKPKPEWKESRGEDRTERKGSFEEKRIKRFFKEDDELPKEKLAKPDFSKFGAGDQEDKPRKFPKATKDEAEEGDFKTVYRGRGKDEKPVYARVPKSEVEDRTERSSKKAYSAEAPEERPKYNLENLHTGKKGKDDEVFRLNKYISNSGICSRREADELIKKGEVMVNGAVITEMGYKVLRSDKVTFKGKTIRPEKPVYILLNKPKDFITTTDDPMERKTVMQLIENACEERVFPVGRLDRNTTGLLLFTNDGELADKLSHPSNEVKKIYQVTLDKPLTHKHEEEILEGFSLEDGPVNVNDMQVLSKDRTILGLEIHLGRNRIVRRIFAHFGYDVVALDRVLYAGLDKKDLPRGRYRFLSEQEVIRLKFLNK
jgi:23S rRNA pseudouridine2605 synthase